MKSLLWATLLISLSYIVVTQWAIISLYTTIAALACVAAVITHPYIAVGTALVTTITAASMMLKNHAMPETESQHSSSAVSASTLDKSKPAEQGQQGSTAYQKPSTTEATIDGSEITI